MQGDATRGGGAAFLSGHLSVRAARGAGKLRDLRPSGFPARARKTATVGGCAACQWRGKRGARLSPTVTMRTARTRAKIEIFGRPHGTTPRRSDRCKKLRCAPPRRVSVSCNLRQARVVWSRKPAAARARARWGRHPCLPVRAASLPPVSMTGHPCGTGNTGQGCPANWQARMPAPPGWRGRHAASKKLRCARAAGAIETLLVSTFWKTHCPGSVSENLQP